MSNIERYRACRVNGTAVVMDQERGVVNVVIARCDISTDAENIARALNTQGAVERGDGMSRWTNIEHCAATAATLVDLAKRHLPPHISEAEQVEAYLWLNRIATDHRGAVEENAKLRTVVGLYVACHGLDRVPAGLQELAASCAARAAGQ